MRALVSIFVGIAIAAAIVLLVVSLSRYISTGDPVHAAITTGMLFVAAFTAFVATQVGE